jgi:exonuclease VII large subunit
MVIRGGGNDSDFAVFNDPCIAQAIYNSKIPVVVGIGHSDNNTFADKAADRSETTPTKAARFIVDMLGEPQQGTREVSKYVQHNKPYSNNRSNWRTFRKAEAGSAVTRFALLFLLIVIGAGLIFFVMPLVFKNILNNLG